MRVPAAIAALLLTLIAWPAQGAEPCEAVQLRGPAPAWLKPGKVFTGAVRFVGDGDMICVGRTSDPRDWVEVRLADFYAPEMRDPGGRAAAATLRRLVLGRRARCVAGRKQWDRIIARCTVGGRPIGDLMREAGVAEGGNGWRR